MKRIHYIVKSIALILLLASTHTSQAQQDAQFTQYMYNTIAVNSAYAGSRGQLSGLLLYRAQWMNIHGAPRSLTFNLHSPIQNSNLGYGISIVNDEIGAGVNKETNLGGTLSYTIRTSEKAKLSFGVQLGAQFLSVDYSKLYQIQGEEEQIDRYNINNQFTPNIGAGIYYHTDKFYAGISIPNMLETEHFDRNTNAADPNVATYLATERMTFYGITGYVFDLSPQLKFKPAMLTKITRGAPLQVDVSANFMYKDKFMLGGAYRWDAAVSAMTGFQISQRFMVGFAYDFETSELATINYGGSYEIFLRYELVKAVEKLVSPRFF
ncbi:MAG: type IX secretion system membrane protein PorP/SprF [Flavobacteriaceae bacterium]|nr:type IX secretion system membrane protein PorP/SprF [Flavobacteriaceae bacterium]